MMLLAFPAASLRHGSISSSTRAQPLQLPRLTAAGRFYVRTPEDAPYFAALNRKAGVLEIPTGHLSDCRDPWFGSYPTTYFFHFGSVNKPHRKYNTRLEKPQASDATVQA